MRDERWPQLNLLSLYLFELEGKLGQVSRQAGKVGAVGVRDSCLEWRARTSAWRGKIAGAREREFATSQNREEQR